MINKLIFGGLLLSSATLFAQTAITITGADVPTPTGVFNTKKITPSGAPTLGNNQIYNYGSFVGSNPDSINYEKEMDSLFTAVGIDVKLRAFKSFNAGFGYYTANEFDYSNTGVDDKGHYVYAKAYELSAFTGSNLDTLKLAEQSVVLSSPRKVMAFPMTANSAWHSESQRVSNFTLSVAAFGLSNTPCQHRYNIVRNDSIVAWGKLSVHTGSGASMAYDVLVDKFEQYAVDSFYVGGSPAPASLQAGFNVSQGQITDKQYAYHFYRKGSPNYLLRLTYGADNTYTTLAGAYINTDNLWNVGVDEIAVVTYQSIMFPNPTNGNEINVQLIGRNIENPTYTITDILGKVIETGKATMQVGGLIQVPVNNIANGNYFVKISDNHNTEIVVEKLSVNR